MIYIDEQTVKLCLAPVLNRTHMRSARTAAAGKLKAKISKFQVKRTLTPNVKLLQHLMVLGQPSGPTFGASPNAC